MTDLKAITPEILEIVRKHMEIEQTDLDLKQKFNDLGMDSIDFVEILFEIEEKYDIEIGLNVNESSVGSMTLGEMLEIVVEAINKPDPFEASTTAQS
jgi:acyl carrier protein